MSAAWDADIQRLELTGSPEDPRAPNPPATVIGSSRIDHTPQYSPDGSRIAFGSDRSGYHEIWVSDRDGSNAQQVTSFAGPYTADPFWSPDGHWIAFSSRPQGRQASYLARPGAGAPKRLTGADIDGTVCGWSRDGKWIYLARPINGPIGANRIWKVSPEGGAPVPVTPGPGDGPAIESADGRFLFYLQDSNAAATLWRMRLPAGEPEKILDAVFGLNFAVTDAGVFFIAQRKPGFGPVSEVRGSEGCHPGPPWPLNTCLRDVACSRWPLTPVPGVRRSSGGSDAGREFPLTFKPPFASRRETGGGPLPESIGRRSVGAGPAIQSGGANARRLPVIVP